MPKIITLPMDEVKNLYLNQHLSLIKIGKLFKVNDWTIRARLLKDGIPIRNKKEARKYNDHKYKKYPIYKNEETGCIMSRQEYENVQDGLTTRGTQRKRKNYGQREKFCCRCGCKLIAGENISAHSFRPKNGIICRQCHTIDVQINYSLHRQERIEYGKNRQGITLNSKCTVDGCDAIWYILNVHHMPDGTTQILCPNHHALWHFDNGRVVRKNRFTDKKYNKWSEVRSYVP
jgi:hypothetical protein